MFSVAVGLFSAGLRATLSIPPPRSGLCAFRVSKPQAVIIQASPRWRRSHPDKARPSWLLPRSACRSSESRGELLFLNDRHSCVEGLIRRRSEKNIELDPYRCEAC
ncbi:hypothetical protein AAFF_G00104760 [Aldrovandia affinis]|uniref:Uncharacterized protein n=1 Tax=Aldrovandia affinis TaxID=143900 RepID=A0AAD7T1W8_9TELE|nr:hypothetical protein AAFF_G00104760 [Aldrovandia affinis]